MASTLLAKPDCVSDAAWEIWKRRYDNERISEYPDEELEALDALADLGEHNPTNDAVRAFMDYYGKLTPKNRAMFLKALDEPQEELAI